MCKLALKSIENHIEQQKWIIIELKNIIQDKDLKIKELEEEIKQMKEGK